MTPTLPPHADTAERNLLGCVFKDPEITDELFTIVAAGDFYSYPHVAIYTAMQSLAAGGKRIDLPAVYEQLIQTKQSKDVTGPYMADLFDSVPTADNWAMYAEKVLNTSKRRKLIQAGNEMVRDATDGVDAADTLVATAAASIAKIAETGRADTVLELRDVLRDCLQKIDEQMTGQSVIIRTGYAGLDNLIGGFRPDKFYIVAARTGIGKTACAMNFALNATSQVPVLVFSMEMASYELGFRVLSIRSSVNLSRITGSVRMDSQDAGRVAQAATMPTDHGFYIDDRSNLSAREIARTVRLAKRRFGVKLVVVDYLQRMNHDAGGDTEASQIERTAKMLKTLARDEGIPVVCLAQLNRQLESRSDNEPRISDIRGSGGVEQEADCIMLLHPVDKDSPDEQQLKVIVAKQRAGPMGEVVLNYVRPFTRLEDKFPTR